MKNSITLLLVCCCLQVIGKNTTFEKLCTVNKYWASQKSTSRTYLPEYKCMSETDWIKLHLSLVEQELRDRSTDGLSLSQRQNRALCLDHLHSYWVAGRFPVNEDYTYRTPIFIDKYDNFCAVGYLIKATGNEQMSRKIARNSNLSYLHDIKCPELATWAKDNGFTTDELAWIQPGYSPQASSIPIGKGVDGVVNELFADSATNELFVGGSFTNADSTVMVNNIAFVTGNTGSYIWHNMSTGVNGTVNAIVKYGGKIFAAGTFDTAGGNAVHNVAYWDGSTWHSAGCIAGTINNLVVFNGELYAAGSFDVCSATHDINFAKWNDTSWLPLPGLSGTINTMEVMDTSLLLGGAFIYATDTINGRNAIRWNNNTSFQSFAGPVNNEVKDFEFFQGAMYAACRHTSAVDSVNLILKLAGNAWVQAYAINNFTNAGVPLSFNTLCAEQESLNMGGQFAYNPFIGTTAANCFNWRQGTFIPSGGWVNVNNTVNKMIVFNGDLIMGGSFTKGSNGNAPDITANGIVKRSIAAESVLTLNNSPAQCNLFPDPVSAGNTLTIQNNINADHYNIRDMNGRFFASGMLSNNLLQQVALPSLATGIYLLELSNNSGTRLVKQFEVK